MKILTLLLYFGICFVLTAQQNWCGTDAILKVAYSQDPALELQIAEQLSRLRQNGIASERSDSIVIPVVFHVLHDNGIGNISHAQIQDAIRVLNEDFNRVNSDTTSTRNTASAPFKSIAANMKICFQLAKLDPFGNCTNGVERRNSSTGTYEGNDSKTKYFNGGGLNIWDRSKYFNIWVVNSINAISTGITLGYAQFPYFGNPATYGVIIRHDHVGSIETAFPGDRTLTHEVGHCLGLFHTFQDGCGTANSDCTISGDYCCDTPPVDQAHWSCILTQNNCSQVQTNDFYGFDALDQFENYMSYSPCQNMFSADQKNIVLTNFNTYSWLSNLSTALNLSSTGVSLPETLCKADFEATQTLICAGDSVNFSDISYTGVSTRNWTFSGGFPSTSSDSIATVYYNMAGIYPVSLNVSDGSNSLSETKTAYIKVVPTKGKAIPIQESFENINFPDNTNFYSSENFGQSDWQQTSLSASLGTSSIFYENFIQGITGTTVSFESGPIDLSSLDSTDVLNFTFDFAHRKKIFSNKEILEIMVSNDCGKTWYVKKLLTAFSLGNQTMGTYFQALPADFKTVSINTVGNDYFVENFKYRFRFKSDGGNNIFIDNININKVGEPALISSFDEPSDMSIFPNPFKNEVQIAVGNNEVEAVKLINSSGQLMLINSQPLVSANRVLKVDTQTYSAGIYYIIVTTKKQNITKKIIKQ